MLCALSQFIDNNAKLKAAESNKDLNSRPLGSQEKLGSEDGGVHAKHNRRHLPTPSGQHTVGCVDIMCDVADHGTFFRLYYPTEKTDIHTHYKQWPLWLPRKQYAHGYVYFLKKRKIFGRLAHMVGGDVHVPVLWQAPLLKGDNKFPVVIVTHGIGGNRTTLSTYCYELASYGFVVAAVEHRDGSASMTLCLQEQLNSLIRDCDDDDESTNNNTTTTTKTTTTNNNDRLNSSDDVFESPDAKSKTRVQFCSSDVKENCDRWSRDSGSRDSDRGSRVRQRRQNRKRSFRHNHTCEEEWRPFEHIEVWDDFDTRNDQMYRRADEISDLLDELISMNEGNHINNALGLAFKSTQFQNRLDISRAAVIGHSFGGAAVLATLATDDRFKVGVSLDAWMQSVDNWVYSSTKGPVMFLNMESFQWEKNVNRMIRFQEENTAADRPMLTLMGGCHQSMSDFQFVLPQLVGRFFDVCYTLRPHLAMSACVTGSLAFLYKHLGLPMDQKHHDFLEGKYPNIISGTNVDLTIPDDGPTPP